MLTYIDSHAHYDDEQFNDDRHELLPLLHDNGVEKIINVGCSLEHSHFSIKLAEKYPFIYAAVGIHPEQVSNSHEYFLETIKNMSRYEKTVAIGEIGLDYHYEDYDKDLQIRYFEEQLDIAKEVNLPVIIHSRDATEDTMNILKKRGAVSGVMHCFSGSAETAKQVLELGLNISFTGVLTFKNANKTIEALKVVPLDRLLLETDCPYMAPEPHRGKRCDSSMIVDIIEKIAEIKKVSPEEVAERTMENTLKLFSKIKQESAD